MKHFNENASVIYTDASGNNIDTFVVFETDSVTGLTHINHENLRVPAEQLTLHAKTICQYHVPLSDTFSFEMLKKLKEKYRAIDAQRKTPVLQPHKAFRSNTNLAKAS
ncbi:MAG: hypothetical protein EOP46_04250 [Sphingobacteriaceae bacterium]|nr:MAG: hypothetical protein EOP46_04250 [Sphingobacteriaceae bacterium]